MTQFLSALTVALALLSPRTTALPGDTPGKVQASTHATSKSLGSLVITAETDIRLDGRTCRYEEIPAAAVITAADVAGDRRTLLRIHFRSPK
jgi:hypothetical protein